jgi:hypothetical protein
MKDASFEDFFGTIRAVAGGAEVLPPALTNSLFSQIAMRAAGGSKAQVLEAVRLTSRERQVIDLLGEGLSNKRSRLGCTSRFTRSRATCTTSWRSWRCTAASRWPPSRTLEEVRETHIHNSSPRTRSFERVPDWSARAIVMPLPLHHIPIRVLLDQRPPTEPSAGERHFL